MVLSPFDHRDVNAFDTARVSAIAVSFLLFEDR